MSPYLLVRYFIENKIQNLDTFIIVTKYLELGISPFVCLHDNKTLFELACINKTDIFIHIFISYWEKRPSWKLHDEVYKINDKDILAKLNYYIMQTNVKEPVKNHLLNVLHLALI